MSFRVRRSTRSDLDQIVELCSRFLAFVEDGHDPAPFDPAPFDPAQTSAGVAPLLVDDRFGVVLVAEHADGGAPTSGLVGYLVLTWGYSLESGGREALIDEVYVEPRGMGIGSALVDAAVAECEQRGVRRLFLETEAANVRARTLYLRHGFDVDDSIWMSRWIDQP